MQTFSFGGPDMYTKEPGEKIFCGEWELISGQSRENLGSES